jgi:hypothetical protein
MIEAVRDLIQWFEEGDPSLKVVCRATLKIPTVVRCFLAMGLMV